MSRNNTTVECIRGDIANQPDMTAIVNAANAQLRTGGGVAGAIHRAAGPRLAEECRPYAPIKPGEAVLTGAADLPNTSVIHCLGPVYGRDRPEDVLLERCYGAVLDICEEHHIDSIALPALSTGAFGYPVEEAADSVVSVLKSRLPELTWPKKIRFVLHTKDDLALYRKKMEDL
jgi:O-acetyl-ADP-ribose deacetylase (regulator of RNase III)